MPELMTYQCETTYFKVFSQQDHYTAEIIIGCPVMSRTPHFGQILHHLSFFVTWANGKPCSLEHSLVTGEQSAKNREEKPCISAIHTSQRSMWVQRDVNASDPQTSFLLCLAACLVYRSNAELFLSFDLGEIHFNGVCHQHVDKLALKIQGKYKYQVKESIFIDLNPFVVDLLFIQLIFFSAVVSFLLRMCRRLIHQLI